ncbi:MAG TPA: hypothetical protein VIT38_02945 [Allosphingosinicella sp.]|jgi:hypothetical protein
MRLALAALLLLVACRQAEAPANKAAVAPPAPAVVGDVTAAQRLVRQRLGTGGEIRFTDVQRRASDGVPIICGAYEQAGVRQRYIVVGGEEAFVEPQMRAGEMERAVGLYCTDGERG